MYGNNKQKNRKGPGAWPRYHRNWCRKSEQLAQNSEISSCQQVYEL